jgi:LysM repeat protein
MEEDIEPSSGPSMVPLALALLAIVLGGAGLYFGLTANQRLAPLSDSVNEGSSSAARIDKQLSALETRLTELAAQNSDLVKTVDRLRVYGSQSEQMIKQVAASVKSNRDEIVNLAGKMNELATSGLPRPSPSVPVASSGSESTRPDIPSAAASTAAPGSATTYAIKSGDTFAKIANEKGVSLNALLDANPDADPRRLRIGQEINIPAN